MVRSGLSYPPPILLVPYVVRGRWGNLCVTAIRGSCFPGHRAEELLGLSAMCFP